MNVTQREYLTLLRRDKSVVGVYRDGKELKYDHLTSLESLTKYLTDSDNHYSLFSDGEFYQTSPNGPAKLIARNVADFILDPLYGYIYRTYDGELSFASEPKQIARQEIRYDSDTVLTLIVADKVSCFLSSIVQREGSSSVISLTKITRKYVLLPTGAVASLSRESRDLRLTELTFPPLKSLVTVQFDGRDYQVGLTSLGGDESSLYLITRSSDCESLLFMKRLAEINDDGPFDSCLTVPGGLLLLSCNQISYVNLKDDSLSAEATGQFQLLNIA